MKRLGAYHDPFTGLFTVPSEKTFRRVMTQVDADALDAAISGYVAQVGRHQVPTPRLPDTPGPAEREQRRAARRQLTHPAPDGLLPAAALDGKALRGARTAEGGRGFLVGAISHEHGVILGQCQIASKKGEGPAARALLSGPDAEWSDTTAVDDDRGHGRRERRTIRTAPTDDGLFPGARPLRPGLDRLPHPLSSPSPSTRNGPAPVGPGREDVLRVRSAS